MKTKKEASKKEKQREIEKTLRLGDQEIHYHYKEKNVKNLNLRVKIDGSVHVSAPYRTAQKYVDNFVKNNQEFILQAQKKFENAPPNRSNIFRDKESIRDGKALYLQGYKYTANIIPSEINLVEVDEERRQLLIHSTYPQNGKKMQENVDKWKKKRAITLFTSLCQQYYPQFSSYGIALPEIKTRKMKARWGSCNHSKKIITFADMLYHAPLPFIEYVVVHEMAHLVEPNHSKGFYQVVAGILPDWKERKQIVKNFKEESY